MIKNISKIGLKCLVLLYAPFLMALDLPGVVKYEAVVQLSVPVSGVVSKVLVEEGQDVTSGELLLQLEETPFKANMDKTAAELRFLKAEYGFMKKENERNKELYERLVLSTVSLQESELKLIRADSQLQAKKAEFARVKYEFEKSRLVAPSAGRIIERRVEPGQTIRSELQAPALFSLADTSDFIVAADVDGDKIGLLSHGVALKVRIAGKMYPATVKSSNLLSAGRSQAQPARYRVRVKLDNLDENLRPGQPATLLLPGL